MFKQYIKHKNITAPLTDYNIRTKTGSSYSKKISSIGLGPTGTILIHNLKTIEIYLLISDLIGLIMLKKWHQKKSIFNHQKTSDE